MTDGQFQEFCKQYSDFSLEYSAEGELIVRPPTGADKSREMRGLLANSMHGQSELVLAS